MKEGTSNMWHLANVVTLNRQHPEFEIPSQHEREGLAVDCAVKLFFQLDRPPARGPEGERMWVRVTSIAPGRFAGELDNDPVVIDGLRPGDPIQFGPEHVADIAAWSPEAREAFREVCPNGLPGLTWVADALGAVRRLAAELRKRGNA